MLSLTLEEMNMLTIILMIIAGAVGYGIGHYGVNAIITSIKAQITKLTATKE